MISELQIKMIIKIGTAKSINAYLKAKYYIFPSNDTNFRPKISFYGICRTKIDAKLCYSKLIPKLLSLLFIY